MDGVTSKNLDHAIRALEPNEQIQGLRVTFLLSCSKCKGSDRHRADGAARYECSQSYTGGARGRFVRRPLLLCRKHAEEFAREHRLKLPAPIPPGLEAPVGWGNPEVGRILAARSRREAMRTGGAS